MREKSNYPNRQHTPETLRDELECAKRSGTASEIADLVLLLANAERPAGSPVLEGVPKARNRQAQRRHHRDVLPANVDYNNPKRQRAVLGDWVEDPSGGRWRVTRVSGDTCWHDVPEEPLINAPWRLLRIVSGPATPEVPTRPDTLPACEALYQGVWDAFETHDWEALERALRAYETALAALGL